MAEFYPATEGWVVKYFRKKASQAFVAGALVAFETNGGAGDPIEPADASDAELIGIGLRTVTSASADYASNTRYPVLVPERKGAEMFGTVGTGTLTVADEGLEVDLKDADEVDQSASTTDVLVCTKFISATEGRFTINKPSLV
jgi:hypothetical protein